MPACSYMGENNESIYDVLKGLDGILHLKICYGRHDNADIIDVPTRILGCLRCFWKKSLWKSKTCFVGTALKLVGGTP